MSAKNQNSYLIQLDGLRFIAVALVLWDHWMPEPHRLPFGKLGVNLFFVLSGFLITRILLTSKDKNYTKTGGLGDYLKKFYIRRTLRIFPIYYLSLIVLWLLHDPSVRGKVWWQFLYASNIYIVVKQTWLGVTDHFWSLAVEEQFYIFFPVLIFFIPRRFVIPFFVVLIGLSVLLRAYFLWSGQPWYVSYVTMPAALDAFGFGALMAYAQLYKPAVFQKLFTNRLYLWLSLAALAVVFVLTGQATKAGISQDNNVYVNVWERFFASIFFMFLIGGAIIGYRGWFKWFLENPVSNYLGKISYGLYVYHNFVYNHYHSPATHPVVRLFNKLGRNIEGFQDMHQLRVLILFALTVVVATASWYLIEKPINNLKDKYAP
ncbi:acyltransferase family protein [Runella sp.]|uniref:acyltransferase family protein n=1 Tax=Runella sp. TaxID=1960881 RepID=UPI003D126337